MPFYIRKSVSAGPFRFNFSKSGVGASVGVKGLRLGTGPRGHYIHAGRGGLYYRATLRRPGQKTVGSRYAREDARHQPHHDLRTLDDVRMIEVDSGEVMQMRDERFSELLDEINEKQQQLRMSALLGGGLGALALLVFLVNSVAGVVLALAALAGWVLGRWLDSYRRTTVLFYDLQDEVRSAYEDLTGRFDAIMSCSGKWHIEAGGNVQDIHTWKRNAGATHLVRKKPTLLQYATPAVIKSNVTPPALHVGRQILYFLPDTLLVLDNGRFGAVAYDQLRLRWQDSNFIEEGSVPRDAEVIGHTWKHPNKSGGPDRRFANNYQIPVCRYEALHLTSATGLNELVELSRTGVSAPFAQATARLSTEIGRARQQKPKLLDTFA